MRYLSLIRIDENTGKQPSQRLMDEMSKLMDEMTHWSAPRACFPQSNAALLILPHPQ